MSNCASDKTMLRLMWLRNAMVVATTMLLLGLSTQGALGQIAADGEQSVEGQLWNITDTPFTFQLRRDSGDVWTRPITLQPGEHRSVRADETSLFGITGVNEEDGYVVIRYPALGGNIEVMLSARTRNDQFIPYWFYVTDSSGIARMIQAKSREQAESMQSKMKEQPAMSSDEIEQLKRTLRANWVLYD